MSLKNSQEKLDQKRLEHKLFLYQTMVNAAVEPITLIDRNYTYRIVNDAYTEARNLNKEDVLNHTVADVISRKVVEQANAPVTRPQVSSIQHLLDLDSQLLLQLVTTGRRVIALQVDSRRCRQVRRRPVVLTKGNDGIASVHVHFAPIGNGRVLVSVLTIDAIDAVVGTSVYVIDRIITWIDPLV